MNSTSVRSQRLQYVHIRAGGRYAPCIPEQSSGPTAPCSDPAAMWPSLGPAPGKSRNAARFTPHRRSESDATLPALPEPAREARGHDDFRRVDPLSGSFASPQPIRVTGRPPSLTTLLSTDAGAPSRWHTRPLSDPLIASIAHLPHTS